MGCRKTVGWIVDPVGSALNTVGVRIPFAPANLINPPKRPTVPVPKPPPERRPPSMPSIQMPSMQMPDWPAPPPAPVMPTPPAPYAPPEVARGRPDKEPGGAGPGSDATRGLLTRSTRRTLLT